MIETGRFLHLEPQLRSEESHRNPEAMRWAPAVPPAQQPRQLGEVQRHAPRLVPRKVLRKIRNPKQRRDGSATLGAQGRRQQPGELETRRPGKTRNTALPDIPAHPEIKVTAERWTPRVRDTVFDPRLSNDSEQRTEANMINWNPRQSSDTLY